MTAPRSIELNKDVLRAVDDQLLESLTDDDFYGLIVVFRNFFRFHESIESFLYEASCEISNVFSVDFSSKLEFGVTVVGLYQHQVGNITLRSTDVLSESRE